MFREEAKTSEVAWVELNDYDEGAYIYIQKTDEPDTWDYTIYDSEYDDNDGGQIDLPAIDNAYDALFEILEDIDDADVRFLDPEDYEDIF